MTEKIRSLLNVIAITEGIAMWGIGLPVFLLGINSKPELGFGGGLIAIFGSIAIGAMVHFSDGWDL